MSDVVAIFYNAEMSIPEIACNIVAVVLSLEFIATVVSALSRLGR